jgi:hypothetical protein
MTTYNTLKKIIPPDQALANQALSRSLRQVKDIFRADLPAVSAAVSQLESNKDLGLINALTEPLPPAVTNFYGNVLATGTGPGNTLTTNDVIGIAAGATATTAISVTTEVIQDLANIGALDGLTANGGTATSSVNGVYTVMSYCLGNAYTSVTTGPPDTYTITIPAPLPGQGTYGPDLSFGNVIDAAFGNLIASANAVINTIASTYANQTTLANDAFDATAQQLVLNVDNCIAAGLDIGNVVNDPANANLVPNSVSTVLGLTSQLHDLGLDITEGGTAQFFENVANTSTLSGQAVIASMREGRNIAVLNAVGIQLDTQLVDVNPNTTVANNLQDAQYSVAQARANIIL